MRNLEFKALEIFKSHQFTADDAEALIEYIREAKSDTLATKKDLYDLEFSMRKDSDSIKAHMVNVELKIKDLEPKIEQTSNNNTKWFVGIILGQTGLIFSLLKLFDKI